MTTWVGSLSLATWQTSPCAASAGERAADIEADAKQSRHGALPDRHSGLHGLAPQFQERCGIGDREGAGGSKGRVFPERMSRNELGALPVRL